MVSSRRSHSDIPEKANRVLNVILVAFALITIRVWYLAVIQHEARAEEARKPQRRTVIEAAKRATIRDRFNIPLAINKIQYNAAIQYSQFKQIPTMVWERDSSGKRVRRYKRQEYIAKLSQLLGNELQIDAERLEDLIHAKAAFYYHVPYIIKEDLSEQEYYRLKMLEKDWLGIHVQRLPKRTYPNGKVGADVIGYMGAINRREYESILQEMYALKEFLHDYEEGKDPVLPNGISNPSEARKRLKDLQENAYTINDHVGKGGVESRFEKRLRGFQGKKNYYSDARGNFLRELPGSSPPTPGERILLSISLKLQEFAEQLLIQNEPLRKAYISKGEQGQPVESPAQPWIKGGSIIAMDPNTGEILAFASYPRFDPNDFVTSGTPEINRQKLGNIHRWYESDTYLADIWDQKRPLQREHFNVRSGEYDEETVQLDWEAYLQAILPHDSPVHRALQQIENVTNAVTLQNAMETLLAFSGQYNPYWLLEVLYPDPEHVVNGPRMPKDVRSAIEENLQWHAEELAQHTSTLNRFTSSLPNHYDKVLLVDLCRLVVNGDTFSSTLCSQIGEQDLKSYRDISAAFAHVAPAVRTMAEELFHELDFKTWRAQHGKAYLKQKRIEEKIEKKYARPYIDYLDAEEERHFQIFWDNNKWQLFELFLIGNTSTPLPSEYVDHFKAWREELLNGAHAEAPWKKGYDVLSVALEEIPRSLVIPYLKTLRGFHDLNRPLLGYYPHIRKPKNRPQTEQHLAMAFYPVHGYGHGRSFAYRQSTTQGSLFKLVTAYAALSQRYRELEKTGNITKRALNPLEIIDSVEKRGNEWIVGYHLNGQPIPMQYKDGRLPRSLTKNIGKINLVQALAVSSNPYFALAAGDVLESPDLLTQAAKDFSYGKRTGIDLPAELAGNVPGDLHTNRTGLYATAIGQHTLVSTPLQTAVMLSALANGGRALKPQIARMAVGVERDADGYSQIPCPPHFCHQNTLAMIGLDFPLFTSEAFIGRKNAVKQYSPVVQKALFMPEEVQEMLMEGMQGVVSRIHQTNLSNLSQLYHEHPEAISDFIDLQGQFIGKTSTSEVVETLSMDSESGTHIYTHTWFGGISFDTEKRPELVVVVYLRFGKYGRDAAPIAAQVVQKWREIKEESSQ